MFGTTDAQDNREEAERATSTAAEAGLADRADVLRTGLAALVTELRSAELAPLDAGALVPILATIERQAAAAVLHCGARAVASTRRQEGGERIAGEWLAHETGRTTREAQQAFELMDATRDLPATRRALQDGKLTTRQAGHIAEAASVAPHHEESLLALAGRAPTEDLQTEARRIVREHSRESADERSARHHRERSLWTGTDDQGAFVGRFRTNAGQGARIKASLQLCAEAVFRRSRRTGRRLGIEAQRMDALELLARLGTGAHPFDLGFELADLPAALRPDDGPDGPDARPPCTCAAGHPPGGRAGCDRCEHVEHDPFDPRPEGAPSEDARSEGSAPREGSPPDGRPRRRFRMRGPGPPVVHAHVDIGPLRRGELRPGETCEIAGVGPVSIDEMVELVGEGILRIVIKDGRDVLSVAHPRRRATAHQQTAVLARYHECCVVGCTTRIGLQDDHDAPWATTQITWAPGLRRVCPHHHARKTFERWDWVIEPPDEVTGKHRLVPPDHPDHPTRTGQLKPRPATVAPLARSPG